MIFLSSLLLLWVIDGSFSLEATFYDDVEFKGDSYRLTTCMNFRTDWNDRVSSINTHGNCIRLHEHWDCTGKSIDIYPGSKSHNDLRALNWTDQTTSVSECTGRVTEAPITTTTTTTATSAPTERTRTTEALVSTVGTTGAPPPSSRRTRFPTRTPSPTSSTLAPTTEYPTYWRNQALDVHNDYRARHGVQRLSLNSDLNKSAQKCADYLATNKISKDGVCHQVLGGGWWGENVGQVKEEEEPWTAAVAATEAWYAEEPGYVYGDNDAQPGTTHFSQVVWKNSSTIGIGYARNGDFKIVVAQYTPPGNIDGRFKENVPPQRF